MTDAEYAKLHIAAVEKCLRTFSSFEGQYTDAAHAMVAKELVAHGWRECIEAAKGERERFARLGAPGDILECVDMVVALIERAAKERGHG